MFRNFTTALLQKTTEFLIENPNFFTENNREAKLEKLVLPKAFINYLSEVKEKEFMKEMELLIQYSKANKGINIKNNKFFLALTEFLTTEFARKLDLLDTEYYLFNSDNRFKVADKLINSNSKLANTLKDILVNKTYQQISSAIHELASQVYETPYILVQSPKEIDVELKKEIRKQIQEENKRNFPIFQINKKLIGGIRIFKNGNTEDHSWLSRVLHFTSLTSA